MPIGTENEATDASDFRWDMAMFKVEGRIFSVNRHAFVKLSPVFEDMYLVGDSGSGEDVTIANPIVLEGHTATDFEALLMVLYPTVDDVESGKFPLTKEQWTGVLRLSRVWQMDKIRRLAIKTLSSPPFNLSSIEKVTLAREHKVASWLLDGLTSLASEELSADALEEAVGLRTAFRLVTIRLNSLRSSAISPISINGAKRAGFSVATLHCGYCLTQFIQVQLKCQSCAKTLEKNAPGAIYMGSNASSSTVQYRSDIGDCFYLKVQYLHCRSCRGSVMPASISCWSCAAAHTSNTEIYVSLACQCPSVTPFNKDSVRDVFMDEVTEYDM